MRRRHQLSCSGDQHGRLWAPDCQGRPQYEKRTFGRYIYLYRLIPTFFSVLSSFRPAFPAW